MNAESGPLLAVQNLTKRYGGVTALADVSFDVYPKQIVGLIGPNGSGKSTTFNVLAGSARPNSGKALLKGRNIVGLKAHRIVRRGLVRTFQMSRVFPEMTVYENLVAGAAGQRALNTALGLIERAGLADKLGEYASSLSYGQQKIVEIVRGVSLDADVVLLDEPFAGVNPAIESILSELITSLCADSETSVVLIDHEMSLVMSLSHYIYVMDHGVVICSGVPDYVRTDPRTIECYFGRTEADRQQ
jgi:branched-chain amino acid transport system ATP-binding protein